MPAKEKNMLLKMFRIMDKSCDQKLGAEEINLGYKNITGLDEDVDEDVNEDVFSQFKFDENSPKKDKEGHFYLD